MRSIAARIAAAAVATLLIAGCNRTSLPAVQSDGQLPNAQLVTDIPIPTNASMDNERSLILSDHDHWAGRVVMRFWKPAPELVSFYQSQMPAFGWESVMSMTADVSVLSYVRSDRAATVQIEKSMMGLNTTVTVTVAPRQPGGFGASASGAGQGGMGSDSAEPAPSRPQVRADSSSRR